MYKKGDLVFYGSTGVCRISEIGTPEFCTDDAEKQYYFLSPLYGTEVIYAPTDTPVYMRKALSRLEAEELIAQMPDIRENSYDETNQKLVAAQYQTSIETHSCEELVRLLKAIYVKNTSTTLRGKKIGQTEQKYMKRAEDLLYGELAAALGIERDDVSAYIEERIDLSGDANA